MPDRRLRRRRGGLRDHPAAAAPRARATSSRVDRTGSSTRTDEGWTPTWRGSPRTTNPRRPHRHARRRAWPAPTSSSASARRASSPSGSSQMADRRIVFALANPDPEVDPCEATSTPPSSPPAASDYPNQINNVLAFPGVFRGPARRARDRGDRRDAHRGGRRHRLRRRPTSSSANYIIPSVFDPRVAPAVASAITAPSTTTHREVLARVS